MRWRTGWSVALAARVWMLGGCASTDQLEGDELNQERQEYVQSINGLKVINGLRTRNGLISINGLKTNNGLKAVNGLKVINGLRTRNGMRTMNGLAVDCLDKALGSECTGEPDGLLSASTGMMASDDGIATASYLVRCALPADQALRVKDYTGGLVTLNGELGFAPEWADDDCDAGCQEKISACLMAFTNGSGEHVAIEMSSQDPDIGAGHSYRYQEAVFYGNVFSDPPKAYYCAGKDFAGTTDIFGKFAIGAVEMRACVGYTALFGSTGCPYTNAGSCNGQLLDLFSVSSNKCSFSDSAASKCAAAGTSSKSWTNPVTTYRKSRD